MRADMKYTDRDVREMPNAEDLITEYLDKYQGEFSFLVDCKMRVATGAGLSVGMMRGVLNCMRADPRVKTALPEPLPDEDGTVLQLRVKTRRGSPSCEIRDFHEPHTIPKGEYQWDGNCNGIYEINRDYNIWTEVTIKVPYMMAKSPTSLLHKVEPGKVHHHMWWPNQHAPGFKEYDPDLIARPICKYPRSIRNPILLTHDEMIRNQTVEDTVRPRCPRCFADA